MKIQRQAIIIFGCCAGLSALLPCFVVLASQKPSMPLIVAGAVLISPALFWLLDWYRSRRSTPVKAYLALMLGCLSCAGIGDAWLRRSPMGVVLGSLWFLYFAYLWFSGYRGPVSRKAETGKPANGQGAA
jgi:hypothetical protein